MLSERVKISAPADSTAKIRPLRAIGGFAAECGKEALATYWTLFKITFPLLVLIKILDDSFGVTAILGDALSPLMTIAGLPGEAGVVWATAIFLHLYAGLIVLAGMWHALDLSVAQVTTLTLIMLGAHALPVELRIVGKAGARIMPMLFLRVGGAMILGILYAYICGIGNFLQSPANLLWDAPTPEPGWGAWLAREFYNWIHIFGIIAALVTVIKILKVTRAERLMIAILRPFLRLMGIGNAAATTTVIGMTLGLSLGGAILIREGKSGRVPRRDMLSALALLGLCHSIVEDTLIMLLVGADLSGILWARIFFALFVMAIFARVVAMLSDRAVEKWLLAPA